MKNFGKRQHEPNCLVSFKISVPVNASQCNVCIDTNMTAEVVAAEMVLWTTNI